ncbi:MAG: hypothetical protein ICV78_04495 [Tolypothrix sp. Co-bin9]|nr:hypothetical protein [Tolypothrix sp. Co-bin9]
MPLGLRSSIGLTFAPLVRSPGSQDQNSFLATFERCAAHNLNYRKPATIRPTEWANREDEGILLVPKAGEILYRLK